MNKRILVEASGSLVSAWLIKAIQQNGDQAVASDITENCAGRLLADDFLLFPSYNEPLMWAKIESMLIDNNIDIIIPSLDETLCLWAEKKNYLEAKYGIKVVISNQSTIETFQDKYNTYLFFKNYQIPTPETSLEYRYPVIKPRRGRGSKGIMYNPPPSSFKMEGNISQELLNGDEFTVDCFFDHEGQPIYIVPRKRLLIKDGKAVNGEVVWHEDIVNNVKKIAGAIDFYGPVNMQCFDTESGVKFIEINPRIGGGMALGFAATENWIGLITEYLINKRRIKRVESIKYGLRMYRYYEEVYE